MMTLRTNIQLFSLFSFIFFAISLGSFKGLVLCHGSDGHLHTEITFNGVDCGHFPKTATKVNATDYLSPFNPAPHSQHCICCVDIPLSFDYSLKIFDQTKTQKTASKLKSISPLRFHAPTNASTAALTLDRLGHLSVTLTLISSTILQL